MTKKATFTFMKQRFCYLCLIILTVASLLPFIILIVNSTRSHAQIQKGFSLLIGSFFLENLKKLVSNDNIPVMRALFNSVYVSFMCALLTTYFSTMTAYGIYMYRFKGRSVAFKTIMAIMMIPTQISSLGFIQLLVKIKLIDTLPALFIPAIASPIVFFYMYQALTATLPYSIVEAARIDGCHEFRIFNTIVVPLMKPAVAVQAIFAFVGAWNNYFIPALVINSKMKKTIPILIAQLRSADYQKFDMGQVYIFICLAIIPLVIVYMFLSRSIIKGVSVGAVKE
ncbi:MULTISPECIES: carbohydrate ABC transporter permease [Treponema]|jgi:multiple sugar transport system permease protein|uniref:Carbohydrate ABC transporter membrane protein 2, CUT1 family n=1 Tax=Treponema saccharophilum DSM 2985 TaxID=907348 RepID=H7EJK3_9SPIR|nr:MULTISPECIES: carbohydrate ABC transporter permease [Treponema]EIC02241.1 carbohydrate ABC transporter membrane protein 2, CUT1 family [Treponema saccharophilum DSM 2985]MBQ5537707.1 carbohydrate ABC transporter permease [Treponema sp.]BDC97291.1 L-arabinose transport system permease protein AraQ [Treponema saccharophilum]